MTAKKILIVGGGIAGLTLAVLAGRRGCAVTVLESKAQFNDGGYVIGVWKNGCTVLWDMGLGEQVESTGRQSAYQLLSDEKGRELKRTDLNPGGQFLSEPAESVLRREFANLINRLATRNNPLFCRFRNALVRMSLGSAKERRLDKFFSRNV